MFPRGLTLSDWERESKGSCFIYAGGLQLFCRRAELKRKHIKMLSLFCYSLMSLLCNCVTYNWSSKFLSTETMLNFIFIIRIQIINCFRMGNFTCLRHFNILSYVLSFRDPNFGVSMKHTQYFKQFNWSLWTVNFCCLRSVTF